MMALAQAEPIRLNFAVDWARLTARRSPHEPHQAAVHTTCPARLSGMAFDVCSVRFGRSRFGGQRRAGVSTGGAPATGGASSGGKSGSTGGSGTGGAATGGGQGGRFGIDRRFGTGGATGTGGSNNGGAVDAGGTAGSGGKTPSGGAPSGGTGDGGAPSGALAMAVRQPVGPPNRPVWRSRTDPSGHVRGLRHQRQPEWSLWHGGEPQERGCALCAPGHGRHGDRVRRHAERHGPCQLELAGATATDWEDIAVGPAPVVGATSTSGTSGTTPLGWVVTHGRDPNLPTT